MMTSSVNGMASPTVTPLTAQTHSEVSNETMTPETREIAAAPACHGAARR